MKLPWKLELLRGCKSSKCEPHYAKSEPLSSFFQHASTSERGYALCESPRNGYLSNFPLVEFVGGPIIFVGVPFVYWLAHM